MKKYFSTIIAAIAVMVSFSSCKTATYTDEALMNNIASNANYTGTCKWDFTDGSDSEKQDVTVQFTQSASAGCIAVVKFEDGLLNGEGRWSVSNAVLTLTWESTVGEETYVMTMSGTISGNGDNLTISSSSSDGTTTMTLKKK